MEVVLEGTQGMPEGGELSIKVGDVKQQGPVSKLGQQFRFANSPAEPLPVKVELFVPAAPSKVIRIDPTKPHFEIDFGCNMKVQLKQHEVRELRRPLVDMAKAAKEKGLPSEKLQTARQATSYLEEHDLVKLFQEMLHGLVTCRPDDPHEYLEEHLARSKQLTAARRGDERRQPQMTSAKEKPAAADRQRRPGRPRCAGGQPREGGADACHAKVQALFEMLQTAHANFKLVLPLLPQSLREILDSKELTEECESLFKGLDVGGQGKLCPLDLAPVIVHLTSARRANITEEQIRRFCEMLDRNKDGTITLDEFTDLGRFVLVANFLESAEGKETIERAKIEESAFEDFLRMIEADKEQLWTVLPFLPQWLVDHVSGDAFRKACSEHFDKLDMNKSGSLEPQELLSVVQTLSRAHPLIIDLDKCRRFVDLFDVRGDGVILRDEFLEFAQLLTVMNFLSTTPQGTKVRKRASLESKSMALARFITMLEEDPRTLPRILKSMPKALAHDLMSAEFEQACFDGFADLDKDDNGVLDPAELIPVVRSLSKAYPYSVSMDQCQHFTCLFDKDRNGVISKVEFVPLARYITLLSYLHYFKKNEDMLVQEVLVGRKKISELLQAIKLGAGQIKSLVPFLPRELLEEMASPSFETVCAKNFEQLDKDKSGMLEPRELIPMLLILTEAHRFAITEEHVRYFVDIFDTDRNGVITKGEFKFLSKFIMVMAFMETEAGHQAEQEFMRAKEKEGQAAPEAENRTKERGR